MDCKGIIYFYNEQVISLIFHKQINHKPQLINYERFVVNCPTCNYKTIDMNPFPVFIFPVYKSGFGS
jgi:hypothetical protein